jgi:hypothetical protein
VSVRLVVSKKYVRRHQFKRNILAVQERSLEEHHCSHDGKRRKFWLVGHCWLINNEVFGSNLHCELTQLYKMLNLFINLFSRQVESTEFNISHADTLAEIDEEENDRCKTFVEFFEDLFCEGARRAAH